MILFNSVPSRLLRESSLLHCSPVAGAYPLVSSRPLTCALSELFNIFHIFRDISKIPRKQSYSCNIPYTCLLETKRKVGNKLRIYEQETTVPDSSFSRLDTHSRAPFPEFATPPSHLENVLSNSLYTRRTRFAPSNFQPFATNAFSTLSS